MFDEVNDFLFEIEELLILEELLKDIDDLDFLDIY